MKLPDECHTLEEIRTEIDEIDHAIISLIRTRFSFIHEIIKFKNNPDEVWAKSRYSDVINDRRKFASECNLDPGIIEDIYRIILDHSIKMQLGLLKNKQK